MEGLFGSLDYIAPEALTRKAHCEATDLWAVGVILYILLSGYPPFWADTTREKQMAIIYVRPRCVRFDARSIHLGALDGHLDAVSIHLGALSILLGAISIHL
eukprot:2068079-Pyramimonas_sp.AAC.1